MPVVADAQPDLAVCREEKGRRNFPLESRRLHAAAIISHRLPASSSSAHSVVHASRAMVARPLNRPVAMRPRGRPRRSCQRIQTD